MSRNRASHLLSDPYSVLRRPLMTEKSHEAAASKMDAKPGEENIGRRYTFEVHMKANKHQIRAAIEAAFNVEVDTVNTMIVKPRKKSFRGGAKKPGYSRSKKKAIIKLTRESKAIDLM